MAWACWTAGSASTSPFPTPPFGSLAQQTAVHRDSYIALPDNVDDLTAAAIANPGMSSWAALKYRAQFRVDESVLINGATGVSGGLAVQIARLMGARHIVVTGRDPQALDALRGSGADHAISVPTPLKVSRPGSGRRCTSTRSGSFWITCGAPVRSG